MFVCLFVCFNSVFLFNFIVPFVLPSAHLLQFTVAFGMCTGDTVKWPIWKRIEHALFIRRITFLLQATKI